MLQEILYPALAIGAIGLFFGAVAVFPETKIAFRDFFFFGGRYETQNFLFIAGCFYSFLYGCLWR